MIELLRVYMNLSSRPVLIKFTTSASQLRSRTEKKNTHTQKKTPTTPPPKPKTTKQTYFVSICHGEMKFCLMCVTNKRVKLGIHAFFSFLSQDGEDLRCRLWACYGPAGSAAWHTSVCCPWREGSRRCWHLACADKQRVATRRMALSWGW